MEKVLTLKSEELFLVAFSAIYELRDLGHVTQSL